jgi:hypothetical protein
MEKERQQREMEQLEIKLQQTVRELQMEIERQERSKAIILGLFFSFVVIYLGARHHQSN